MENKYLFSLLSLILGLSLYLNSSPPKTELSIDQVYRQWKDDHSITFTPQEDLYRMRIFQENVIRIREHNALYTHTEGLNHFGALTPDQFAATYLSTFNKNTILQVSNLRVSPIVSPRVSPTLGPNIDWVASGAVSPVKNQGSCTATYAFSAVGAIEGISAIFFGSQTQYSVQQIVDCSGPFGNSGCTTGLMTNSFDFVTKNGITSWAAYPYVGRVQNCLVSTGFFKIRGYSNVADCVGLANALTGRPVSVAVDGRNFQFYVGGIYNNCGTSLSLAVLLVGMTDQYWTLKNSFGSNWGEKGYIRITRGNTCGVCQAGSYPIP